jgi:hypothetical protein
MWLIGAIGATATTIVGMNQAWPIIERRWPATHEYVQLAMDEVRRELKNSIDNTTWTLRDIQVEATEGKLEANKDLVAKWTLERTKTSDPITQSMIDQRLKELNATDKRLQEQLKMLQEMKRINANGH